LRPNPAIGWDGRKLGVSTEERAVDCTTETANKYLIGLTYDTSIIYGSGGRNDAWIKIFSSFFQPSLCARELEKTWTLSQFCTQQWIAFVDGWMANGILILYVNIFLKKMLFLAAWNSCFECSSFFTNSNLTIKNCKCKN